MYINMLGERSKRGGGIGGGMYHGEGREMGGVGCGVGNGHKHVFGKVMSVWGRAKGRRGEGGFIIVQQIPLDPI